VRPYNIIYAFDTKKRRAHRDTDELYLVIDEGPNRAFI